MILFRSMMYCVVCVCFVACACAVYAGHDAVALVAFMVACGALYTSLSANECTTVPRATPVRTADMILITEYEKLIRALQSNTLPTDEQLDKFINLLTFCYVQACTASGRAPIAALVTSRPPHEKDSQ